MSFLLLFKLLDLWHGVDEVNSCKNLSPLLFNPIDRSLDRSTTRTGKVVVFVVVFVVVVIIATKHKQQSPHL